MQFLKEQLGPARTTDSEKNIVTPVDCYYDNHLPTGTGETQVAPGATSSAFLEVRLLFKL